MTSELRPAVAVWQEAYWTWANDPSFGSTARSVSIIEADREAVRAETVKEIVAWLNRRAGQVLQLHAEAKTDHERNIVDEHASAIEQSAIEIEAKFGGSHD